MRIVLFIVILTWLSCFLPVLAKTQGGCRGFGMSNGNEIAHDIIPTSSGNYLVVGETNSLGQSGNAFALKMDPQGQILWQKAYGATSSLDYIYDATSRNDSFFLVGETKHHGNKDIWVLQLDNSGNQVNSKTIGGSNKDIGQDIIVTNNDKLALTGQTLNWDHNGNGNAYVMHFQMDPNTFNVHWTTSFGDANNASEGRALTQNQNGSFIIAGESAGFNGSGDFLVFKLDQSGDAIWHEAYGGANSDVPQDIMTDNNNNTVIVGSAKRSSSSTTHYYAIKIDDQNNVQWKKTIGGTQGLDNAYDITQANDGDYIITGASKSFTDNSSKESYTVKLQANGQDTVWTQAVGKVSGDKGLAVEQKASGTYFMAGATSSSSLSTGNKDFLLYDLSQAGNIQTCCAKEQGGKLQSFGNSATGASEASSGSNEEAGPTNVETSPGGTKSGTCGALPVDLLHFNLQKGQDSKVKVSWKTASETNNAFFTILRRPERGGFTAIDTVNGQGTSTTLTSYAVNDRLPAKGTYYYQIRQTDYDGSQSHSTIRSLQWGSQPAKAPQIKAFYPQSGNRFRLELNHQPQHPFKASLLNLHGKVLKQFTLSPNQEQTLTMSILNSLKPSMLLLRLIFPESGEIRHQKVILSH